VEETFYPVQTSSSAILAEVDETPPLRGYVATQAKPLAQVVLASPEEDPILAIWQYGLGRSIAFTSDATARWASDWIGWPGFVTFWAQSIRAVAGRLEGSLLAAQVVSDGEAPRLQVDARSETGAYLNGLVLEASVVAPGRSSELVVLRQVAPGLYESDFTPGPPGAYLIRVVDVSGESSLPATVAGWVRPYSPEYRQPASNPEALVELVRSRGGWVAGGDPEQVFAHTLRGQSAPRPIRTWALPLAAALLVLDIAARRLAIGWSDFQRIFSALRERLRGMAARPPLARERSPHVRALFDAKQRARRPRLAMDEERAESRRQPGAEDALAGREPKGRVEGRSSTAPASEIQPAKVGGPLPEKQDVVGGTEQEEEAGDPSATAARLLARKRERRPRPAIDQESPESAARPKSPPR
jgi:hypothetical protein